jgi:hypothetical protein
MGLLWRRGNNEVWLTTAAGAEWLAIDLSVVSRYAGRYAVILLRRGRYRRCRSAAPLRHASGNLLAELERERMVATPLVTPHDLHPLSARSRAAHTGTVKSRREAGRRSVSEHRI